MAIKNCVKNKKSVKAFTLVELVIVIAVIAVLSAILIPVFGNIIDSSKKAKTEANLKVISTELVTQAYSNGVDYFTLETVKDLAKDLGFDLESDEFFIPEGHSVWYDQATFNLKLVADAEMFAVSDANGNAELAVFEPNVSYGSNGLNSVNSVVANLPRRPEAISSDKNKLIIASNNESLMDAIEKVYSLGDSEDIAGGLIEIMGVFSDAGIPREIWSEYQTDFSPETTLYVRTNGQLVALENGGNGSAVKNVVISKNATTIDGAFYGTETVYQYNFDCIFEIPDTIEMVDETFNNVAYNGVSVVIQNAEVIKASNLNVTVVNVGAGLVDNSVKYDTVKLVEGSYQVFKDTYIAKYANNYTVVTSFKGNESAIAGYLADRSAHVPAGSETEHELVAKYFMPRVQFNLAEVKKQLYKMRTGEDAPAETDLDSVISISSVAFAERNYGDYRMLTLVAVYVYTDDKGEETVCGARLGNGFGYITTLTPSTTNSQTVKIAGEGEEQASASGVSLSVSLPSECVNFENYHGLSVEVEYTKKTTYYKGLKSVASDSMVYLKKAVVEDETVYSASLTLKSGSKATFTANVEDFEMMGSYDDGLGIEYFRNSATITKVTVKNGDGLVLYVQNF